MEKNELSCPAALAVLATLILVGVFVWKLPVKSSDWAAWMQAFGSLIAIGVAVWATLHQQRVQAEKEKRNERREQVVMMQSIAAELSNALEMFSSDLANRLEAASGMVAVEFSSNPFPVYSALAPRISQMPTPDLSERVIAAYSHSNGLLLQLKLLQRLDATVQDLTFKLPGVSTAQGPGSILEINDVLKTPNILDVGKSAYDALLEQIAHVDRQRADVVAQICQRRDTLPAKLQQLIADLRAESGRLAEISL